MIPQFPEFKKIELDDRHEVSAITEKHHAYSDFEFGSLYAWDVKEDIELSMLNANLIVKFTDYITGEPFLSFIGNNEVNDTTIKLIEESAKRGYSKKLSLVPEVAASLLSDEQFEIEESRDHADYILDLSKYITYAGGKLKHRRNFFNGFMKMYPHYTVEQLDLTSEDVKKEVTELYRAWQEGKGFLSLSEAFAYERFLQVAHHFNHSSIGVRVDGKLVGFHVSTLPPGDHANGLFEKADINYHGIYPLLMHEVAKDHISRGYNFLNFEQDLGILNLRRSKLEFDPVNFFKKYNVSRKKS
jgi:hypothetical protein